MGEVMGRIARWSMVAVAAGGLFIVPTSAAAAPPTTVPDEGAAGPIACPSVGSLASTDRRVRLNDGGGSLECTYTPGFRITVNWIDAGQPGGSNCDARAGDIDSASEASGNSLFSVVLGNASVGASIDIRKEGQPATREEFVATATQLIVAFEPISEPCAPSYICTPTIGEVPYDDFFGNEDRSADTWPRPGTWEIECAYAPEFERLAEGEMETLSGLRISVTYATPAAAEVARITPCAAVDEFAGGFTVVDGPGTSALFGKIDASNPSLAYDIDAARAELDAMIATFAPEAVDCAGVPGPEKFSPLPAWLADVWDPAFGTGQPTLLLTPGGSEQLIVAAELAPQDVADAPATTVPTDPTTPPPTTEAATEEGITPVSPTTTVATPATTTSAAPESGSESASSTGGGWTPPGWLRLVLRIFAAIALPLSILGIAIALFTLRKESRIRPKLDAVRMVIMAAVGVVTTLVLGRSTPAWVFVVAIVSGVSLGLVQGRNLEVRVANDRLMAKRSRWAIVAFLVGLVCSQVSGLLGRVGVLSLGIGLTMLSAALAAGISVGRRPKVRAARASVAASLLFVFVAAPITALVASESGRDASIANAQEDEVDEEVDDGDAPEPEPTPTPTGTVNEQLAALVDWDSVRLVSGYGVNNGKPPVELALPVGLATVPEPQTFTSSWSREWAGSTETYNLDETYSFALSAEGVCCAVSYAATGTEQRGDNAAEAITAAADLGSMVSVDPNAFRAEPFGRQEILDDGSCGRQFVRTGPIGETEPTFSTLIVGDDDSSGRSSPELQAFIPCEIPGFTTSVALDQAPEPPPIGDPRRINFGGSPCPVYQEVYGVFADDDRFAGQAQTRDLIDLFRSPNRPACEGSAYAGDEKPGGLRNEFQFSFASLDPSAEANRQRQITETFGDRTFQHEVPAERRCVIDERGLPQNGPDQDFCLNRTFHEFGDGQVTIWTNTDLADGPDTTIRGNFPWGSYFFNCHHCEVGDPYIAQILNEWHQFAHDWNANGLAPPPEADAEFAEPSIDADPDAEPADEISDTDSGEETATDAEGDEEQADDAADQAEADADASESDDGVDIEDAAAVALVSLLGAAGIAGTTIAESGRSASELLDAYRNGGLDRVGELLDEDLEPPERPDDPVRGWDPNEERFRDMTRAERDRLEGVDRAQRREERLERDAATLADIRADRAGVDRLTELLQRRDEIEADLLAAEREQDRWSDPAHVRQAILDGTYDGILRETDALPGELRELAQTINRTMNDPATWETVGELASHAAWDAAGMMSPVRFGDGQEHLNEFGRMLGDAFREDPVGFMVNMSPLGDLRDSLDGERTLGQRLGSMTMVLAELFPAMAGSSLARDAANLGDAARDLDRATEMARNAERANEFADSTRNVDRTLAQAVDARRRATLTQSLDDIAEATSPAARSRRGLADDIEAQIARHRTDLGEELGSPLEQSRRTAWEQNQRAGAAAVDDLAHQTTRSVSETETIADLQAAQREAALRVQTNKNALQQIKNQPEHVQRALVNQMREIYDETDAEVLDWATDYINKQQGGRLGRVEIKGELRLDRIEGGRTIFVDDVGNEIQLFEPTNATPGEITVGADRDFTAYVKPAGSKGPAFSLPRDEVGPVYRDAFYDSIGGDAMRERLGIPEVTVDEVLEDARRRGVAPPDDLDEAVRRQTVDRVAERLDQAVTDDLDPEAYKNVRTTLHRPFGEIGDAQQVGLTMTHKGEEWSWRAEHSAERAAGSATGTGAAGGGLDWSSLSEDQRAEAFRQIVKQNGNQMQPRLEALQRQTQYLIDQGKLPPKTPLPKPDPKLDGAIELLDSVKEKGRAPVDVERELRDRFGMTPSDVSKAMGERVQMMEQLRPPEVAELQQRMGRIADKLDDELLGMENPADRIPTEQQVWDRLLLEERTMPKVTR